ncbi:ABC transporter ATP-binding protein [Lactococcus petauri]|jgi:putative ABC transport system ATP-binding protein|uniref:ABC transporter ATP-binding protein n=1 Tax=Lactococcus garvieae TaxID=1363 RepID=A0AA46TTT4_9LACT|nr:MULTISPECIES: ABC transporter ATP-binding protein [Lactococcus]MDC0825771.1 ABC transporter ATP-binding protein [Lactococcus petauri]NHI77235.1 ABC transporter ATP-binding protein [Lactococcus petauri]USI69180.1 ABC transporter ATP-binding protein [Lactococcus petauri]UYT09459.1 ABC transporter ATP-binding protein [Lactococcus garvieae]UYT13369.1 ABC transporter ATP-binding protein [Lactococcus garvieae]
MTVLNIENLTYYYNHPEDYLFQDVTETFEAGIMYSILGQSGSGKTTLLSLLAGLDMPKSGQIKLNGDEIKAKQLTNYRKNIVSTIFQAYNLLTYMSAFENVKTALRISKVSFDDEKQSIIDSLEKVGLTEDLIYKPVSKLSGGQQQRVAIARALVLNHDIIIADEPTGNLDENTTRQIVELFKKIAHEDHKLVIIVTHETEVAQNSDVVYQLKNKKFTKLDAF